MRNWVLWVCLPVISLSSVHLACAQQSTLTPGQNQLCQNATFSQPKYLECLEAEARRQSALHDEAYKRRLTHLSDYQKQKFELSEQIWLQYLDAECAFQGSVDIGGPLGIVAAAQADAKAKCLIRETNLRTKTLTESCGGDWKGSLNECPKP